MKNEFKCLLLITIIAATGCGKSSLDSTPAISSTQNASAVNNNNQNTGTASQEAPLTGVPLENFSGVPVYRSLSGKDFFFSTNPAEGPKGGYFPQEARFGLSPEGAPGTAPLYRCFMRAGGSHFLSRDRQCEGQVNEGVLGGIAKEPAEGLVPLSRYVNLSTSHHIVVVPNDEKSADGHKLEGVLGYVTELRLPQVIQTPDDGKKYFGYYAGAMDGVGDGNYISELKNYSNLIFIKSHDYEARLAECEARGFKAVITFDWLFFDQNLRLTSDYEERFKDIEPVLRRYSSTIVAFYGLDEPYANSSYKGVGEAEVYYAQETMGRFLKSKFPNTPIGVIFTTHEILENRPLFPSFDWYGFDCYDSSMSCNGKSVPWYYDQLGKKLEALTAKDKKKRYIMSIPQAGYDDEVGYSKGETEILTQVPYYREIVKNNSNVKVVMPFIWQRFNDGLSSWVGAREIPSVKAAYQRFYYDFITGRL